MERDVVAKKDGSRKYQAPRLPLKMQEMFYRPMS